MAKSSQTLEVEGQPISLSNLDKVLYPATGFTKADAIDYYIRISPYLLPHLKGRAITLKRYPDGVEGKFFYEKNCPAHRPTWVKTAKVEGPSSGKKISFCLVDSLPSLIWAINLASLELHPSLARPGEPESPAVMVLDLDPGPPADIVLCCEVAFWLRKILQEEKQEAWPKTSGSKGLQLYVPLPPGTSFDDSKAWAKALAQRVAREHPDKVVSRMQKSLRVGKVFIDWSQNSFHKTTVSVYSLRARERPTVSTPVTWEEVRRCKAEKDPQILDFTCDDLPGRVAKLGDLFFPLLSGM